MVYPSSTTISCPVTKAAYGTETRQPLPIHQLEFHYDSIRRELSACQSILDPRLIAVTRPVFFQCSTASVFIIANNAHCYREGIRKQIASVQRANLELISLESDADTAVTLCNRVTELYRFFCKAVCNVLNKDFSHQAMPQIHFFYFRTMLALLLAFA